MAGNGGVSKGLRPIGRPKKHRTNEGEGGEGKREKAKARP